MTISERTTNTLRRLHSLTGILPIGLFLAFHLFTNSKALHGPEHFNSAAGEISKLPYVTLIEIFGIALPILFHMVLGVLIAVTGQMNTSRFTYERNWGYVLQRASGLFLVVFIITHVWSTRFVPGIEVDLFGHMAKVLQNPGVFAFYVLGVTCAAYHLGNGLFGFSIHWGIATGRRAQRQAARLGFAVFILLTLVSLNALLGFVGKGVKLFERAPESAAVAHTEVLP
jgi:succinate dehydrogenase / fumarate reductase, cytochrome b subunit